MDCGTWEAGPSSWRGRIPKILLTSLKVNPKASPIDQVKQAYEDIYSKIQQTSQFSRNNAITVVELSKPPRNATPEQQLGYINAQKKTANAAIHGLVLWANSFIDQLNAFYEAQSKDKKSAQVEDESDNPLAAVTDVSPEDFAAVSRFLQYADAHSLQDAAEAAGLI